MKTYSQNKEDLVVFEYFKGRRRTLLSIGENNGETFSNAKLLIDNGWYAELLEPGSVFEKLALLHADNSNVCTHNFGIGLNIETVTFYESQEHIKGGAFDKRLSPGAVPTGLVSSTNYEETQKWRAAGIEFKETKISLLPFEEFHNRISKYKFFEFISIDTEGNDWNVLQQLKLDELFCECLCIEWNGHQELLKLYSDYCEKFKMKEIYRSAENLIFAL